MVITRDGAQVLSALSVQDALLRTALTSVLTGARRSGDGSKTALLLLEAVLTGLAKRGGGGPSPADRTLMVATLRRVRGDLLPRLKKEFFEGFTQKVSSADAGFQDVFRRFLISSLSANLAKSISRNLVKILYSYISADNDMKSCMNRCQELILNRDEIFFYVFQSPIHQSKIIKGHILSRDYKVNPSSTRNTKQKFVLWSIPLIDNKEEGFPNLRLETSDEDTFFESFLYKNRVLTECLLALRDQDVTLIISSVNFPDWAAATCQRHHMGLADSVDSREFEELGRLYRVSPVQSPGDVARSSHTNREVKIDVIQLGKSRYLLLEAESKAHIVLCAPTPTQCQLYSSALIKTCRQVQFWVEASTEYDGVALNHSSGVAGELPFNIYWCNAGGFVPLQSYFIMDHHNFDRFSNTDDISLLKSLLLVIPKTLFDKSRPSNRNSFLEQLTLTRYKTNRKNFTEFPLKCMHNNNSVENPFAFFSTLDNTLHIAEGIVKIDSVLRCNKSVKNVSPHIRDNWLGRST